MTCWNNCVRMIDSGCIRTLRFSWFFMIFHDFWWLSWFSWFLMISHDFWWFLMIFDDISWFLMVYHVFYDISWFLMIFMIFHNLHDFHDFHQYVASRQPNIINMLLRDSEILWYWWFLMIFMIFHDFHQYVASRQPNIINMLLRDSEILWYFMISDDFWWFMMIFRDISWFFMIFINMLLRDMQISSICCFETAKYHQYAASGQPNIINMLLRDSQIWLFRISKFSSIWWSHNLSSSHLYEWPLKYVKAICHEIQ